MCYLLSKLACLPQHAKGKDFLYREAKHQTSSMRETGNMQTGGALRTALFSKMTQLAEVCFPWVQFKWKLALSGVTRNLTCELHCASRKNEQVLKSFWVIGFSKYCTLGPSQVWVNMNKAIFLQLPPGWVCFCKALSLYRSQRVFNFLPGGKQQLIRRRGERLLESPNLSVTQIDCQDNYYRLWSQMIMEQHCPYVTLSCVFISTELFACIADILYE